MAKNSPNLEYRKICGSLSKTFFSAFPQTALDMFSILFIWIIA